VTVEDLLAAENYHRVLSSLQSILGTSSLHVLSHDLGSLHELRGTDDDVTDTSSPIDDDELIDALLACRTHSLDGATFVPIPARRFPLLIARYESDPVPAPTEARKIAGQVFPHAQAMFDRIEELRRPESMSTAAQLQWSQLALRAERLAGCEIAAVLVPALDVAGDLFDFGVNPAGVLTAVAMDAMGHGVEATLSASLALAAMRTTRRQGGELSAQMEAADAAMLELYGGERFVTAVALEVGPDGVSVVNAGHEPVRRVSGRPRAGSRPEVVTLDLDADPPLGLEGRTEYRTQHIAGLEPGDGFCLLSDGAAESRSPTGEELGELATNAIIEEAWSEASLQAAHRISVAVGRHTRGPVLDDITTLVVQRR